MGGRSFNITSGAFGGTLLSVMYTQLKLEYIQSQCAKSVYVPIYSRPTGFAIPLNLINLFYC